jgi:hypothetical protein
MRPNHGAVEHLHQISRLAGLGQELEERLEHPGSAETPEPLPDTVPLAVLPGQGAPGDAVDGEKVQRLQKLTVIVTGLPQSWGSRGYSHRRVRIVGWLESLSEAGAESTIINSATNLKQQIGAASRPPHLPTFVHPAVHQEIGRSLGDRGSNPQSGTVPLGVIDQPVALAGQITIQRVQAVP